MSASPSIDVRHLRKVDGEVVAVDDLTVAVPRGAVLGLLGGNGAGKTTTIAMPGRQVETFLVKKRKRAIRSSCSTFAVAHSRSMPVRG